MTLRICFDIDGVIAWGTPEEVYSEEAGWAFEKCTPIQETIDVVRELYRLGHEVYLYTARYEEDRPKTVAWLEKYEVPYHSLTMGKPHADLYIDDKNYPKSYIPAIHSDIRWILEDAKVFEGQRR